MNSKMDAQEKKWKAESDAYTLADAHSIQNDSARFKAAQRAAKNLAEEAQDKADGMSKVASGERSTRRKQRIERKYKGIR